jgi:ArsR family transcriptional regulator, arsenate/arsenite/antimonite-responsive transcriptional repressor
MDRAVGEIEDVLQGLADRTRLRLLNLMRKQEVCVCYFVQILALPQSTISRHLAYLRRKKLVTARRDGKWMHYRLNVPKDPGLRQIVLHTLDVLAGDRRMRRESSRLGQACCSPAKIKSLSHAPSPQPLAEWAQQESQ